MCFDDNGELYDLETGEIIPIEKLCFIDVDDEEE